MPNQSQDRNNEPYRITAVTLTQVIFKCLFNYGFLIYYTYSYTTIPKDLLQTNVSNCFLAAIILSHISRIPEIIEIIYTWRHLNEMTTKNLWSAILPTNHLPLIFIRWVPFGVLGIGCYFLDKFIPVGTNHCDQYTGVAPHACISLQMISVFTIIGLIFLGLAFLVVFCSFGCICCLMCTQDEFRFSQIFRSSRSDNPFLGTISSMATSYLPIVTVPPPDKTCAICFEDPVADEEAAKKEQWMVLNCEHKFHPHCIQPWLAEHRTCPMCRAVQS